VKFYSHLFLIVHKMTSPLKLIAASCLLYATWMVAKCPCNTVVGCARPKFYAVVGIALATTVL